jgi:DNA mismatch repair ATPase MutS
MKAFLMYRNRDFDPQLLLTRRERELRHSRNSDQQALNLQQLLPWNEPDLRQDLGLDILFRGMAQRDPFLFEVALVGVLLSLTDLHTIRYRQHILADSLKNASIVREIYQIAMDAIEGEKKNYWSFFSRYPGGTLHRSVDVVQMFVGILRRLRKIADQQADRFESEGFSRLFAMLRKELSDDYFLEIEQHLDRLKFRHGTLISAHLGKGNMGKGYVLRRPNSDNRNWVARMFSEQAPVYKFQLHPRDETGARALSVLNDRGVNLVANALAQSTDHILSFFQMLRTELGFYVGCLNLYEQLADMGEPVCFPVPTSAGERALSFSGLYDVSLALTVGKKIVGNDLAANQRNLVVITGANTGGKSTFLRSVGVACLMMQAGMFVPAEAFSSELSDGLFTHYKREEDAAMESGKWDEELSRMSELVGAIKPNSTVLFNESFASTNEREGSEIASQIVRALLDSRVRVFFVTHLYHFAHTFFGRTGDRAIFLRAERRPDGSRPFKLVVGEPLQTSYGEDLYDKIFSDRQKRQADVARSDGHSRSGGTSSRPGSTRSA